MRFEGRTICITGGGRGIGRALGQELANRRAAKLLVAGRHRGSLPDRWGSTDVSFIEVDLAQPSGPRLLAQTILEEHPDCSVLINNAGMQVPGDCLSPESGEQAAMFSAEVQLNFTSPVCLGLLLMPVLLRHSEAAICNVTSGLALAPKQSAPVYCASKAALSSYTRSLRYQAAQRAPNVRIFEALPPLVDTEMTQGRGRGKISAEECARQIIAGMERNRYVIDVGKTKLLRAIMHLSPSAGYRIMRDG